jgi:murein DD-endopeptidase MepM/ murein hydrolase activator NlpD
MTSSGVDLHSGDVMNVHMSYDGTALSWTITDVTAGKTFNSLATFINIPSVVGGGTAFVGFTGGAGGLSAIQDIMSWTYAAVVAMPTFDPPASLYGTAQSVTISDTTSGALIFYTTDGSKPTTSSTQYSGPIAAGSTTTINAIAVASGWSNSAVSTATFTIRNGGAGGTFTWPVDAPVLVAQFGISGAPSNDYSAYNGANPQNEQFHTGIDVCPMAAGCQRGEPVYAAGDGVVQGVVVTSDPVQTLCDGSSSSSLPNNGNSNLGNAVIIAHANGKFTVYGHLDCIWPGISAGVAVSQGVRIGSIGNSAFGLRRHFFTPHTHFEMKDSGVLGDPTNKGYSGYTPDLPDGYGYHDARIYLFPFSVTNISATAVKVVASPSLDVRSGPGTTYAFLTKAATGQEFVAFATSGSWYQIYLPNSNGPISGWIEGGQTLAVPDPAATQIQVFGTGSAGLLIRPSPGATTNFVSWDGTFFNCAPGAKIWDGQRFVTSANQSGWFQYYLPASHYFDSSNACGIPLNPGPSLGWSSGSFLH